MRLLLEIGVIWPMPVVWLLLVAVLLSTRRFARRLFISAAILLTLSAMPFVGDALLGPLSRGAVAAYAVSDAGEAAAVVVPTAGSFRDPDGVWWPAQGTIMRGVAGQALSRRTGLPLILVGGAPYPLQPAEAETASRFLATGGRGVQIVPHGRDSASSAIALAAAIDAEAGPVILLTDAVHTVRMRAVLRHAGIAVALSAFVAYSDPAGEFAPRGPLWRDFVPTNSGLGTTRAALREYVGIAWYLVSGRIAWNDL